VREGFIVQHPGPRDRRQRLLELTPKGVEMERMLSEPQRRRIAAAYRDAGPDAVEGYLTVMLGIMNPDQRRRLRF
jgi:DNA-binding MarR family transcriptional regulator